MIIEESGLCLGDFSGRLNPDNYKAGKLICGDGKRRGKNKMVSCEGVGERLGRGWLSHDTGITGFGGPCHVETS